MPRLGCLKSIDLFFSPCHHRAEWSIGDDSSPTEPAGVFDSAAERTWFDVGQDSLVLITLDKGEQRLTSQ